MLVAFIYADFYFVTYRYCFLCNRWLAVEEDDGMIDRLLPVASKEDMTNFQNLFMTKTKKSFTDSHLWIDLCV